MGEGSYRGSPALGECAEQLQEAWALLLSCVCEEGKNSVEACSSCVLERGGAQNSKEFGTEGVCNTAEKGKCSAANVCGVREGWDLGRKWRVGAKVSGECGGLLGGGGGRSQTGQGRERHKKKRWGETCISIFGFGSFCVWLISIFLLL